MTLGMMYLIHDSSNSITVNNGSKRYAKEARSKLNDEKANKSVVITYKVGGSFGCQC